MKRTNVRAVRDEARDELAAEEKRLGITPPPGASIKRRFRAVTDVLKKQIAEYEAEAARLEREIDRAE